MAKKATKKTKIDNDDEFLKSLQKGLSGKALVIEDTTESFVPWKVPFKHAGLQKITGGLLGGKIMIIEAESQCGKSYLLYELLGNAIRMGGWGYIEDTENAFEPIYGAASGIDFSQKRLIVNNEKVIEPMYVNFDTFIKKVRDNKIKDPSIPIIIGLDSTAPTRCMDQYVNDEKGKATGHGWERRANAIYEMVDKLTPTLRDYAASFVIINQLRNNNKAGPFENPIKAMLKELEYRSTQQLRGTRLSVQRDEEDKNKRTGMGVRWETYKNRFVKPKQVVRLKYGYETGLSKYSGLFDLLVRENEVKKADIPDPNDRRRKIKGCYVVGDENEKFYALSDAKQMFEDFPHLLEPLYVKVHDNEEGEMSEEEVNPTIESIE